MNPYDQGYEDWVLGVNRNPFVAGDQDWYDWRDGWEAAREEAEAEMFGDDQC